MSGPIGLMFAALLVLGLGFAMLDRWLRRGAGPARMLISLGMLYSVLDYEGSWDSYTTTARGICSWLLYWCPSSSSSGRSKIPTGDRTPVITG